MNSQTLRLVQTCDEIVLSRLSLLSQLSDRLQELATSFGSDDAQGLDANLSAQEELMKQLDALQLQYTSTLNAMDTQDKAELDQALVHTKTAPEPAWCGSLLQHLREQAKLLQELDALNRQAQAKSLAVLEDAKKHLKSIKTQKDMINGYYPYASARTGRMLDTK